MQIVRELADEGNPIAKIAFLTRLAEGTVREILAQLPCSGREPDRHPTEAARESPARRRGGRAMGGQADRRLAEHLLSAVAMDGGAATRPPP